MKLSGNLGKAYYTAVNSLRQPKAFSFIFQWVQLFLALGQTVDQNLIIMLFPSKMLTTWIGNQYTLHKMEWEIHCKQLQDNPGIN